MKAKFVNEILNENFNNRLKIYFKDGIYEASQNGLLWTFKWSAINSKVYNLQKVGRIGPDFQHNGTFVKNPHIQMILQFQRKIKETR